MSASVDPVDNDEVLCRVVLKKSDTRQDGTVKPDAFMPARDLRCSVTRLMGDEDRVWARAQQVARLRGMTLRGRADVSAQDIRRVKPLNAEAVPVCDDPLHADITGWPPGKPEQKGLALELAVAATYFDTSSSERASP